MGMRDIISLAHNTGDGFLVSWLCFLCAGLFVTVLAGGILLLQSKLKLHQVFAVTVFWMGILYMLVLPPLSAPDEVAHYISAYKLSSQMLGEPVKNEKHQILIRSQDVFIDDLPNDGDPDNATVVGAKLKLSTYRELHDRGLGSTGEEGITFSQQIPVSTIRTAYLPQAIGFSLARLLNLGGFGLLYLGRLMNLLFFLCVTGAAIRRIPVGKEILFGISLFPMTLELASSLSYDTYILALSFYLTAVCTEFVYTKRQIGWWEMLTILLLAALLAPCKMVYAGLFGLCFLIAPSSWRSRRGYVLSIALTVLVMAVAVVLVNAEQLFKYVGITETVNELSWAGDGVESYSLMDCLQNPLLLCYLLINTFYMKGSEFLAGMAGHWMGNLDHGLEIPYPVVICFWLCLLLLSLRCKGEARVFGDGQRLWLLIVSGLTAVAVCISMLAAYTPKGEAYIRGIQGRYFLAALPPLLLVLRSGRMALPVPRFEGGWRAWVRPRQISLTLMLAMNAWVLLRLFRIVCFRLE